MVLKNLTATYYANEEPGLKLRHPVAKVRPRFFRLAFKAKKDVPKEASSSNLFFILILLRFNSISN